MITFARTVKTIAFLALMGGLLAAPQAAHAAPVVCTITGTPMPADPTTGVQPHPPCNTTNGAVLGPVGTDYDAPNVYWAAISASNNGVLGYPIDSQGICRYIDNRSATPRTALRALPKATVLAGSLVQINFKTMAEWSGFISNYSNTAGRLYAIPCARPTKPGEGIDTGARTAASSQNYPSVPVVVDVSQYGHPAIAGRALTNPASQFKANPSYVHTRRDCNAYNICNTVTWTETFAVTCTAVVDAANNNSTHDGAKWSCVVTDHDNPEPAVVVPETQACGDHEDGSKYFINVTGAGATGSRPALVPSECQYGVGTRQMVWTNQIEVQCQNGAEVATGQTRNIDEHFTGTCAPQPAATCIFRNNGVDTERLQSECCAVPGNLNVCGTTPADLPPAVAQGQSLTLSGGFSRRETFACQQVATTTGGAAVFSFVSTTTTGTCEPAMCGDHASGTSYWKDSGTSTATTDATREQCPAGGHITTTVMNQKEHYCDNGTERLTGNTRQVNPVVTPNCNPVDCNGIANGGTIWQTQSSSTTQRAATTQECPGGGSVYTTVQNQTQYLCTNGQLSSTGQTREANAQSSTSCNPAPCGATPSGSVFSQPSADQVSSRAATTSECAAGGTIVTTKSQCVADYLCTNGSSVATGATHCTGSNTQTQCTPAMCNGHQSNTYYWLPGGTVTEVHDATAQQCPYGGKDTVTMKIEKEYFCRDGVQTGTSGTRLSSEAPTHSLQCNEPAACGDHLHGSSWNENCAAGYSGAITKQCINGSVTTTTNTCAATSCGSHASGTSWTDACPAGQVGSIVQQCNLGTTTTVSNSCAVPPASCGAHPHGSTWTESCSGWYNSGNMVKRCDNGNTTTVSQACYFHVASMNATNGLFNGTQEANAYCNSLRPNPGCQLAYFGTNNNARTGTSICQSVRANAACVGTFDANPEDGQARILCDSSATNNRVIDDVVECVVH